MFEPMRKKVRGPRRFALSDEQEDALVSQYGKDKFPSKEEREQLATQLQLTYKQVDLWFRNRRYRDPSNPAVGRAMAALQKTWTCNWMISWSCQKQVSWSC